MGGRKRRATSIIITGIARRTCAKSQFNDVAEDGAAKDDGGGLRENQHTEARGSWRSRHQLTNFPYPVGWWVPEANLPSAIWVLSG